ncbi:MAG: hypothetical protein GX595_15785 [Lentisphaerae bacterium]|nr:hypothetical protein [Lentisphaerota bacterium]
MGFLANFMPFYPKPSKPRSGFRRQIDIDRALDVELHRHPTLETRRADSGELVLRVRRELHPMERFLSRFVKVDPFRQIVLDAHGEFLLTAATQPGVRLTQVAEAMAQEFKIDLPDARLGVIHLVRELMVRGFVFLVRHGERGSAASAGRAGR